MSRNSGRDSNKVGISRVPRLRQKGLTFPFLAVLHDVYAGLREKRGRNGSLHFPFHGCQAKRSI